jgi:GNAT superfamily N-acetyltransferase
MTRNNGGSGLLRVRPGRSRFSPLPGVADRARDDQPGSLDGVEVIRPCRESDLEAIYEIVNDAAAAYRGVIPADCWQEPYMPADELRREIAEGVRFFGFDEAGALVGVMGLQDVREVTLIRHAYTRMSRQGQGIGGALLSALRAQAGAPLLVGTWADAAWAVRFYERRGFRLLTPAETDALLRSYWHVPPRQATASVVLADRAWLERSEHAQGQAGSSSNVAGITPATGPA